MKDKITIKQEALLPPGFKIIGVLMLFMGGTLCVTQFNLISVHFEFSGLLFILIGLVLILGGLLLITAHYRLTIDPANKTYHVAPWLLGYVPGKADSFQSVEKIYINPVKLKHNNQTRSGKVTTVHSSTFKAFMKLANGEKVHLDTDKNLEKLEVRVAQYQEQLQTVMEKS